MYELSVALKYLIPKWRQLSVSIISVISVIVIALVVWLILIFYSVTQGLEKNWIEKMIALSGPIRITPKEAYYQSYYYQIDSISSTSDYTNKSIRDKLESDLVNPYDPDFDEAIPHSFTKPDLDENGNLRDLVKIANNAIHRTINPDTMYATDFEIALGQLHLDLLRIDPENPKNQILSQISYMSFLAGFDPKNPHLEKSLLSLSDEVIDPEETSQSKVAYHNPGTFKIPRYSNKKQKLEALPQSEDLGEGILVPRQFKDAGVRIGDKGHLSYSLPTTSTILEQTIPVFVFGFYDPGILPMGGKVILVKPETSSLIRGAQDSQMNRNSNGIYIQLKDYQQADAVKRNLEAEFEKEGISSYFTIESFRDFDTSKEILQQLQSEKNLLTLISIFIILVACSNIISMLIILVNDKKLEIGILRSLGATTSSIAAIFGICGIVMGFLGSLLGTAAGYLTLSQIQALVDILTHFQGFDAFNPAIYGDTLPNEMSQEGLKFVFITTCLISFIAGVIPAVKASMMQPAKILRAD